MKYNSLQEFDLEMWEWSLHNRYSEGKNLKLLSISINYFKLSNGLLRLSNKYTSVLLKITHTPRKLVGPDTDLNLKISLSSLIQMLG